MTNRIASYPNQTSPIAADPTAASPRAQPADVSATGNGSSSAAGESATITGGARLSAELLGHARAADGIDHAAVSQLKTSVQSGTYSVPADQLAASILAAKAEVQSK